MLTFFSFWQLLILAGTLRFALWAGCDMGNPQFIMWVLTSAAGVRLGCPSRFKAVCYFPAALSEPGFSSLLPFSPLLPYESLNLEAVNVWETAAITGVEGFVSEAFLICAKSEMAESFSLKQWGVGGGEPVSDCLLRWILCSSRVWDCWARQPQDWGVSVYLMVSNSRIRTARIKEESVRCWEVP